MLLLAGWLGWKRHTAETQRVAAEFILSKKGGYVGYDYEYDAAAYRLNNPVLPTNKTLIDTFGIDWFHSIVWVELRDNQLTDQDLAKVTRLKSIRGLVVSGCDLPTDDEFGEGYFSADISALSLERIGKLRNLQRLSIDVAKAEASGTAAWHKLSKLEELTLLSVDDSYLGHIARIPQLKRINLWSKVTNHVGAKFSEEALLKLSESPSLQVIKVSPSMSVKTVDQLKKAHPNLKIRY